MCVRVRACLSVYFFFRKAPSVEQCFCLCFDWEVFGDFCSVALPCGAPYHPHGRWFNCFPHDVGVRVCPLQVHLSLGAKRLGDQGMWKVAQFLNVNTNIQHLDLQANQIGRAALRPTSPTNPHERQRPGAPGPCSHQTWLFVWTGCLCTRCQENPGDAE